MSETGRPIPEEMQNMRHDNSASDVELSEKRLSPEQKATVLLLIENQLEWARSLGIKANRSEINVDDIVILSKEDYLRLRPASEGELAFHNAKDKKINLADSVREEDLFSIINHELLHGADGEKINEMRMAFMNLLMAALSNREGELPPATHYANEVVTEMMNLESLNFLRAQSPDRNYLVNMRAVAYECNLVLVDAMIEKVAVATGSDSADIRKKIYEGYYAGTLAEVWQTFSIVDQKWPGYVTNMPFIGSLNELFGEVQKVGVDPLPIRDFMNKYIDREPVTFFGHVNVSRRPRKKK